MLAPARCCAAPAACSDSASRFHTAVSVRMPPVRGGRLRLPESTLTESQSVAYRTWFEPACARSSARRRRLGRSGGLIHELRAYFYECAFSEITFRLRELFLVTRNAGSRPGATGGSCTDSVSVFRNARFRKSAPITRVFLEYKGLLAVVPRGAVKLCAYNGRYNLDTTNPGPPIPIT
jgi:hypothetical protein